MVWSEALFTPGSIAVVGWQLAPRELLHSSPCSELLLNEETNVLV